MTRCSVCAREIPETKTVCDVCGRWAAEPVAAAESRTPEPPPVDPVPSIDPVERPAPAPYAAPAAPPPPVAAVPPTASPSPAASPLPATSASLAAPPAVTGKAAAPPKRGLPALGAMKGRRGVMAGLGVAAVLVIAFLAARPAPSNEATPAGPNRPATKPSAVPQADRALQSLWSVNSKRWGATQKKSIAVELTALNRVQVWTQHVQPVLVVRCVAKATEVFVFTDSPIAMEPDSPDHTVRIAFDDQPEQAERWPDSLEHDSLFAPDGAAFARRLLAAQTLQFGFRPHNSPAAVARFQVSGLRPLIEPAAKDCGWK